MSPRDTALHSRVPKQTSSLILLDRRKMNNASRRRQHCRWRCLPHSTTQGHKADALIHIQSGRSPVQLTSCCFRAICVALCFYSRPDRVCLGGGGSGSLCGPWLEAALWRSKLGGVWQGSTSPAASCSAMACCSKTIRVPAASLLPPPPA